MTRLYIFKVLLITGEVLYKVGKSKWRNTKANEKMRKTSKPRFLEVLSDFHTKHRYIPQAKIKRDREVAENLVFKYETILHNEFVEWKYTFDIKFDGSDEFFIPPTPEMEKELLDRFDVLIPIKGKAPT